MRSCGWCPSKEGADARALSVCSLSVCLSARTEAAATQVALETSCDLQAPGPEERTFVLFKPLWYPAVAARVTWVPKPVLREPG